MKITGLEVHDWRYPTSLKSDGSDAVHKDPDYSCVYVVLKTDSELVPESYGLTFTLGRGNEVVKKMCESMEYMVVGKDFETEMKNDLVAFSKTLTQDGQMRWIGPEKGVLAMACGAVLNAVWDLWARIEKKPLWELVVDLPADKLVDLIDFKHLSDVVTREEALKILKDIEDGADGKKKKADRKKEMIDDGFPAYTTSAGWLGYPPEKIKKLCQKLLEDGHTYFKMKVGSENHMDDVNRAKAIREVIGYENTLMMDANQKWDVPEAIEKMKGLSEYKPLWIEEPTNCDDVIGHRVIQAALLKFENPVGVATGEVAQNKVIFKQLLQGDTCGGEHSKLDPNELPPIQFCQIDSCRIAGVSEILSVLLIAAKYKIKVCPHAGGVGLCEYVRHLSMIDYCCFAESLEGRICESTTHLHEFFEDTENMFTTKEKDGKKKIAYRAPKAIGFAKFTGKSLSQWTFPCGAGWVDPRNEIPTTDVDPEHGVADDETTKKIFEDLKTKSAAARAKEQAAAAATLDMSSPSCTFSSAFVVAAVAAAFASGSVLGPKLMK